MNMLRIGVIFFALFVVVWGQTTEVSQCVFSRGTELPLHTYIEGCTTPPCRLPQLEDAVIHIIFRAPRTMRSMKTLANAFVAGLFPLPHDLKENAETCNFLVNSYCPVLEGEVLRYTLHMYIENFFREGLAPTVEFRIEDENSDIIICLRVPIVITAPNSRAAVNSTVTNDATDTIDIVL